MFEEPLVYFLETDSAEDLPEGCNLSLPEDSLTLPGNITEVCVSVNGFLVLRLCGHTVCENKAEFFIRDRTVQGLDVNQIRHPTVSSRDSTLSKYMCLSDFQEILLICNGSPKNVLDTTKPICAYFLPVFGKDILLTLPVDAKIGDVVLSGVRYSEKRLRGVSIMFGFSQGVLSHVAEVRHKQKDTMVISGIWPVNLNIPRPTTTKGKPLTSTTIYDWNYHCCSWAKYSDGQKEVSEAIYNSVHMATFRLLLTMSDYSLTHIHPDSYTTRGEYKTALFSRITHEPTDALEFCAYFDEHKALHLSALVDLDYTDEDELRERAKRLGLNPHQARRSDEDELRDWIQERTEDYYEQDEDDDLDDLEDEDDDLEDDDLDDLEDEDDDLDDLEDEDEDEDLMELDGLDGCEFAQPLDLVSASENLSPTAPAKEVTPMMICSGLKKAMEEDDYKVLCDMAMRHGSKAVSVLSFLDVTIFPEFERASVEVILEGIEMLGRELDKETPPKEFTCVPDPTIDDLIAFHRRHAEHSSDLEENMYKHTADTLIKWRERQQPVNVGAVAEPKQSEPRIAESFDRLSDLFRHKAKTRFDVEVTAIEFKQTKTY